MHYSCFVHKAKITDVFQNNLNIWAIVQDDLLNDGYWPSRTPARSLFLAPTGVNPSLIRISDRHFCF